MLKYNLLFFDFRYFGHSEGKQSTAGLEEVADIKALKGLRHPNLEGVIVGKALYEKKFTLKETVNL